MKRKRKNSFLLLLIVLLCFITFSCTTSKTKKDEVSDEEVSYAIKLMLSEVCNRAFADFKIFISEYNFIPEELDSLNAYRHGIPGLNTILNSWTGSMINMFINESKPLESDIKKIIDNMEITNPKSLIKSGDRSASVLLATAYYPEILEAFNNFISTNLKELKKSINQFNIFVDTTDRISTTYLKKIHYTDQEISKILADLLCNYLLNYFITHEELYRTTPNSSNPQIIRQVFEI